MTADGSGAGSSDPERTDAGGGPRPRHGATAAPSAGGAESAARERRERRERGAGMAAVVVGTVAFSWGGIVVKLVPLEAAALAAWRLGLGTLVLGTTALALRVRWPGTVWLALLAGGAFGAHQLLFVGALQATSVAIVMVVAALQPLVVALASRWTVDEPVSWQLAGCAVVALTGVAVVVLANTGDPSRSLEGDLLSAGNLLAFTAYFLLTKRARQEGAPTLTFTTMVMAGGLAVVLPVALLGGQALAVTGTQFGLIALLAFGPGNGHLLVNWAHRRVSAALSSLVLASVPALSAVWAYLVLDEPFGWPHVLGVALVIASIEGGRRVERARLRRAHPVPAPRSRRH